MDLILTPAYVACYIELHSAYAFADRPPCIDRILVRRPMGNICRQNKSMTCLLPLEKASIVCVLGWKKRE